MQRISLGTRHARPALHAVIAMAVTAAAAMADGAARDAIAASEDLCEARAAVAAEAAGLRKEGLGEAEAAERLATAHAGDDPKVLTSLRGVVRWSYMAKMAPDAARAYFKKQCLQN